MSTYFELLKEELQAATERRYGPAAALGREDRARSALRRGRWTRRPGRWRGWPAIIIVGVAIGAGSAAAATQLLGGTHGLTGSVPSEALSALSPTSKVLGAQGRHGVSGALRYAIPITPNIEPGQAGWCGAPVYVSADARRPLAGGTACATGTPGAIGVLGGGEPLTNLETTTGTGSSTHARSSQAHQRQALEHWLHGRKTAVQLDWFIYRSGVSAVKINGVTYPTTPNADLPAGWRALVLFVQGSLPPRAMPLDHAGHPLKERASAAVTATSLQRSLESIPIRHINPRELPPDSTCAVGPARLAAGMNEWEAVTVGAPSLGSRVEPNTLFSCARAWYAVPGSQVVYSAALLLNAQNPTRAAPRLPGLTAGPTPGTYEEDAGTGGQLSARRVANAWLVVEGPDQHLRDRLLQGLAVQGSEISR
jgi:hypothetical protein